MKYKEWLKEWLENYVKPSSKIRTLKAYTHIVEKHIAADLGECELESLTPIAIQRFVTTLTQCGNIITGRGLAANTVNSIITVLKASLKLAYELDLSKTDLSNKIKRPKNKEKEIRCFTIAEQKKIEEYVLLSDRSKLFGIVLCLYSGLRIGELLALKWEKIDFSKGIIIVNASCYDEKLNDGKFCRVMDTPKTFSSNRMIPIPKQLLPLLKSYKRNSKSEFVVSDEKGKVISIRSYQRSFELMQKKLKIPHKGFHALRHTFATRAIESGMDIKTLAEILGHKNPTVTLNRYVHSLFEHKQDMMNNLGKIFR